ncbi:MAG: penicillin-binding protein 2 [Patescibacteria group bacterium]
MQPDPLFGPQELSYKGRSSHTQQGYDVDSPLPQESKSALTPPLSRNALRVMTLAMFAIGIVFFFRIIYLEIIKGSEYRAVSEENRLRVEWIPAVRGLIYDRQGNALVSNEPQLSLLLFPKLLPADALKRKEMAALLKRLEPRIDEATTFAITDPSNALGASVPLLDSLDRQNAVKIMAYSDQLPGIQVETALMRFTKEGESLSHAVGFMGRIDPESFKRLEAHPKQYQQNDFIGKTGIEQYYEETLRGMPGRRVVEVDARGETKATIAEESPVHGTDLTLSISVSLQDALFNALTREVRVCNSPGGAAVALDPRNGEILALVSAPSFNAHTFAGGDATYTRSIIEDTQYPLFNRAIAGQYPTGSIIKPIFAAAALNEGIVTPSTVISSTGGLKVGAWFFPDWKAGGHGLVTLRGALAESVNTYFYIIGGGYEDQEGLGVERMARYAGAFGLGDQTHLDLFGEATGFLPTPQWKEDAKGEPWYIGDTYHFAIGQGDVLATPLQMAIMTAVFANGGNVVIPHLLQNGTKSYIKENLLTSGVLNNNAIDEVKKGLVETVRTGSARSLAGFPVPIAGKTGTAQIGGDASPHAWFTAYAPADAPEIVITVIVEQGGEGSAAAVPVARDGFLWWYQQRND